MNESNLTGEPDDLEKIHLTEDNYHQNVSPFLLAKTLIKTGQGKALVCAVGVNTRSGMAGEKLGMEDEETPLQQKLATIADDIGKLGMAVAALTFTVMTGKLLIKEYVYMACDPTIPGDPNCNKNYFAMFKEVLRFFIIAITVIVVAIPEGLPLAVTISLAYSVQKMYQEKNLVRKLEACETMGGADQICTDKTGTLTKNIMTVKGLYTLDKIFMPNESTSFE